MITMHSFCRALLVSVAAEYAALSAREKFIAAKRIRQNQIEREWRAELARRAVAKEDADGSLFAAKQAFAEKREDEQLASLAAQISLRQARRS